MSTDISETPAPFSEVKKTQALLETLKCPFWVAGGWAVDLYLGRVTRPHKDIEIALARADQGHLLPLANLRGIEYIEAGERKSWRGQELRLPVHELYAHFFSGETVEILLNEFDGVDWIYRRNPKVRLSREMFQNKEALPVEVVMLYKAKNPRSEDEKDFSAVLGRLSAGQRSWLSDGIALDFPSHPWLKALKEAPLSLSDASRGKF